MQADSLVYQAEKQVKELADKAPEENKAKVGDKIKVCGLSMVDTFGPTLSALLICFPYGMGWAGA